MDARLLANNSPTVRTSVRALAMRELVMLTVCPPTRFVSAEVSTKRTEGMMMS